MPDCDCGATVAKTPHAKWCSSLVEEDDDETKLLEWDDDIAKTFYDFLGEIDEAKRQGPNV